MKKLFKTNLPESTHAALLFFRIAIGALMLTHGIPKLQKLLSGTEIQFADPFGFGPAVSLVLVIFAEVLCSLFVIVGFATRLAVIPLMITMLTAVLYAHADDPFGTKEKPLLFFVVFAFLLVIGSGRYSVDSRIVKAMRD